MYDTVIKNGTVVTASAAFPSDVAILGGQIGALGHDLQGDRLLDASDCYVIPGGVDVHVHLELAVGKWVSSDTFGSGTTAAALGGTTSVIDFVHPEGQESMLQALGKRREEADGHVAVDYGLHMNIPAWHADHALGDIPAVMAEGIYSFKLYQAYGTLCLDDLRLYRTLVALTRAGALPILHSENGPVIDQLRAEALAAGRTEPRWHERTRPSALEGAAVHSALALADLAQAPLYIVHVSCAEALAPIAKARSGGKPAYGETCPQYLYLTDEQLQGPDAERYICAPPLRPRRHHKALWDGLRKGSLQVVATDHCPFWMAEKQSEPDFTKIPGGLPSIEARLGLVHEAVNRGELGLCRWVDVCSTTPAKLFKLARKGRLAPGYDADVVVFDPRHKVTLRADRLHEQVDWTPYEGINLVGWPRDVLLRGRQVVRDGMFVGQPGWGRYISAS